MGPSFIKLGQMLSTRADLLGEQVAFDLAELQDHLPPFDSARARRILEEEFGQPVEALFVSFDPVPVSAASIAQVHNAMVMPEPGEGAEATASEPRPVAVKILRSEEHTSELQSLMRLSYAGFCLKTQTK